MSFWLVLHGRKSVVSEISHIIIFFYNSSNLKRNKFIQSKKITKNTLKHLIVWDSFYSIILNISFLEAEVVVTLTPKRADTVLFICPASDDFIKEGK